MNISQIASPSEHLIDVRRGRSWGEGARVFTQNWAMYSAVLAFGVALIFALLFSNPPEGGAVNWPLAAIALGLLSGGMIVFVLLSAKVHTRSREVGLLERRLAGEASASRVLAGIKLLGVAESEGDVKGSETGLAGAVRMATGYSAAIVFDLRDAHGVFSPSDTSYEGQFVQSPDEYEPIDGNSPGALAARKGSAVVLSQLEPDEQNGIYFPKWAERAGFLQGIVTPITRGLDTVGVVYVFNKSTVLPTLNEIEQLELIVSFAVNIFPAGNITSSYRTGPTVSSATNAQPFRIMENRPERRRPVLAVINMPGFVLNPELETMELDGISLTLSPIEFLLIHTLASTPGRPVSPEELVNTCWSSGARPADNALDVAIFRLRRKLRKTSSGKNLIKTIRGNGYMFVPPALTPEPTPTVVASIPAGSLVGSGLHQMAD